MEKLKQKSTKELKEERLRLKHSRANQQRIQSFLSIDPHLSKTSYFDKQREEINKLQLKHRGLGINNTRAIYAKEFRERERREERERKQGGMFGL